MARLNPIFFLSLTIALSAWILSPALRSYISSLRSTLSKSSTMDTSTSPPPPPPKEPRMPVYFFSHGGPDVMYNTAHPVYPTLQHIGSEITSLRPTAVLVFSAHWQSPSRSEIHVNAAAAESPLIYDFSGFPLHYYSATYPNVGSPELAARACSLLSAHGIPCSLKERGLDHGVWAGFHVAFNPDANPLNVPLVQVSLFRSEDPDAHYRLGRAVSALRDEGVVIIGAGMSVHNLYDMGGGPEPMPYSVSFDNALKEAVESKVEERQERLAQICTRPDAKQAHPWMDHLMPIHVAAGAAGDDLGKQLWTMQEGSFAWAQYRFGSVSRS